MPTARPFHLKGIIDLDEREKETLTGTAEDVNRLNIQINSKNEELDCSKNNLESEEKAAGRQKELVEKIQADVNKNTEIDNMISINEETIQNSTKTVQFLEESMQTLKNMLDDSHGYKNDLFAMQEKEKKYNHVFGKSVAIQSDYNRSVEDWIFFIRKNR